jgi:hypothetical protein
MQNVGAGDGEGGVQVDDGEGPGSVPPCSLASGEAPVQWISPRRFGDPEVAATARDSAELQAVAAQSKDSRILSRSGSCRSAPIISRMDSPP